MMRTYEPPRMPQNWSGEAKSFYLALIDVLDELHLPIQELWLSDGVKKKLNAEQPEPYVPEEPEWQEITALTNCTAYQTVKVGKTNTMRMLKGEIVLSSSLPSGASKVVATLPEDVRPSSRLMFTVTRYTSGSTTIMPQMIIDTDGTVTIRNPGSTTLNYGSATLICVNATWMKE